MLGESVQYSSFISGWDFLLNQPQRYCTPLRSYNRQTHHSILSEATLSPCRKYVASSLLFKADEGGTRRILEGTVFSLLYSGSSLSLLNITQTTNPLFLYGYTKAELRQASFLLQHNCTWFRVCVSVVGAAAELIHSGRVSHKDKIIVMGVLLWV